MAPPGLKPEGAYPTRKAESPPRMSTPPTRARTGCRTTRLAIRPQTAGTSRLGAHARRPEQPGADDRKQGREESELDQQHDADADGQSRTHPPVEAEARQQQAEERANDGQRGEGDGRPHPGARGDDGLVRRHARRQVLPVAEQEEEAVVGARAEHQRRQQKLQQ